MDELGLTPPEVLGWFNHERNGHFILVRMKAEDAAALAEAIGAAVRRCYVTDVLLEARARETGLPKSEILAAKLPDPGSTMAGDFGEILAYLYHASTEHPRLAFGPKKWRLKQDRTKPAPLSDVLHFILPQWPTPATQDVLLCSEVKTKATNGSSSPITEAIKDCAKDRVSRLARTLVWLRERATAENLGSVQLKHLQRFINTVDFPPATRKFFAVAVICSTLADGEIVAVPAQASPDYSLIVIKIPNLRDVYTAAYHAAQQSIGGPERQPEAIE
jgi:hypothetical protein